MVKSLFILGKATYNRPKEIKRRHRQGSHSKERWSQGIFTSILEMDQGKSQRKS